MSSVATPAPAPRRRRRRRTKLQRRQTRLAWLLLIPALAVVAFVAIYPLGKTVYQSFTNQEFLAGITPTKWVGLDNYRTIWHDPAWKHAIILTLKFTVITVSFEFVLGLIIALVVNSSFKGRGVMRAVMLVPWAIPTVVAAQMWKWMLDDTFGVVNDLGVRTHVLSHSQAWISNPSTSLGRRLRGRHLEDDARSSRCCCSRACRSSRATSTRRRTSTAPASCSSSGGSRCRCCKPAILVTLIFRTLDALRVFDVFYVFFGNRLDTQSMAIYIQSTIVGDGNVGLGAAASVFMFLIIALFVVIYVTFMRVNEE